eukprot:1752715-Heterocapsa_arctica.AAC.1
MSGERRISTLVSLTSEPACMARHNPKSTPSDVLLMCEARRSPWCWWPRGSDSRAGPAPGVTSGRGCA